MNATFDLDRRIIDLPVTHYRRTEESRKSMLDIVALKMTFVLMIFITIMALIGSYASILLDPIRLLFQCTLTVDCYMIQLAYYGSKLIVDTFTLLLFGVH